MGQAQPARKPSVQGDAVPREPAGVRVLDEDVAAASMLDGTRRRILERLREPASATEVARSLDLPRQRVNYHVRELEKVGLVEEVARRRRRGLEERIVRATARHWLISSEAIGALGAEPARIPDRFSATYQVAVAARTIREVGHLMELAHEAGKPLPTLTVDTEVRFRTPAEREAFAEDLLAAVSALVARYHDGEAADGRTYRLFLGAHPVYRPEGAPAETPNQP